MSKLGPVFNRLMFILASIAGVLVVGAMVGICIEVVSRSVFNKPILGMAEITEMFLPFITFLGAAWLLKKEKHIAIDSVVVRLGIKSRAMINLVTSIICMIACAVVFIYGVRVTVDHFYTIHASFILEIPDAYILWVLPLAGILLTIQFIIRSYGYLKQWRAS